jgi:hypothetical protein
LQTLVDQVVESLRAGAPHQLRGLLHSRRNQQQRRTLTHIEGRDHVIVDDRGHPFGQLRQCRRRRNQSGRHGRRGG